MTDKYDSFSNKIYGGSTDGVKKNDAIEIITYTLKNTKFAKELKYLN